MAVDLKDVLPLLIERIESAEDALPDSEKRIIGADSSGKVKLAKKLWDQFGPLLKPALEGLLKKGLDKILNKKKKGDSGKSVTVEVPAVEIPDEIIPANPTVHYTPAAPSTNPVNNVKRKVASLRMSLMLVEERDPSVPAGNPQKVKGGLKIASHARFVGIKSGEDAAQTKVRFFFDITPVDQYGIPFESRSSDIPRGPEGEPIVKIAWEVDGRVMSDLVFLSSYHDIDAGHTPVLVADWGVEGRHVLKAWAYYEEGTPWTVDGKRVESNVVGPLQFDE